MVTNSAFVFVKPHAVTDKFVDVVREELTKRNIKILAENDLAGEVIDEKKLIDQHYYAIASKATILKPDQLNVPADKFKEKFGLEWTEALASGKVFNAMDGCKELGLTADELDKEWAKTKKADRLVKFGGGFYCGRVEVEGKDPLYIFNGFFMSMRSKFTVPGTKIHYFVVEFEKADLAWEDFRGKVLGPTDPATAPADSLRGMLLANWQEYGVEAEPNVGDNGVHASASPFEGMAECLNWLSADLKDNEFAKQLVNGGMTEAMIKEWTVDPQVQIGDGKKGSIFDQLEDMDSDACAAKAIELSKLQGA